MQRLRNLAALCAIALALFAGGLLDSAAAQDPSQRHLELKQLMLELINDARHEAGAPAVRLGSNGAAQLHAEQMVDACFHSHWGIDGLKPYMRYSLLGGYQGNAENVAQQDLWLRGSDPCALRASAETPDLEQLVRDAMTGWLNSPGHRRNLLDPTHRLVNVGIAWRGGERYIFRAVQHFEGDYVRLNAPISLAGGVLTLSGRVVNGASLPSALIVYHDPQPKPQSRASLALTSSYCGGYPVAAVLPSANWTYRGTTPNCVEPSSGPRGDGGWVDLPVIAAERWKVDGATFEIRADLSSALQRFDEGVYTVALSGEVGGEETTLLEYALFYNLVFFNRAWVYSAGPISASTLTERVDDLEAVFRWDGVRWRGYAERGGRPIPGAVDFAIAAGDWLWLTPAR